MTSSRDHLVGLHLDGRYRIDALVARGGMSAVYSGVDLRLDRTVAIKVMDRQYSVDPQFLARMEFEARAVASLNDPGLIAVYDQGIDDDVAFLVMELIDGGTLRDLLRERGPMPPHAMAALSRPVLRALGTAHEHGLVHRDVKPENVLISQRGAVKIADFGLVRAVAAAGVTAKSVVLGTAAYLAPEQVEHAYADARSDVYAAGVMIYEMLTGRTPFTGDTPLGLANARLLKDVPPPSTAIAGIPADIDHFVITATRRNPQQRFADGAEMAAALDEITTRLRLPSFTVRPPTESPQASARRHANPRVPQGARPPAPRPIPGSPPPATEFVPGADFDPAADEPYRPAPPRAADFPPSAADFPPRAAAPQPPGTRAYTRANTHPGGLGPDYLGSREYPTADRDEQQLPPRRRSGLSAAAADYHRSSSRGVAIFLLVVVVLGLSLGIAAWALVG